MKKRMSAHIKGAFYITRQSFHTLTHIFLGIAWFQLLNRFMPEISSLHLFLSLFGSLLPDFEHVFYFYVQGRSNTYSKKVRTLLKNHEWRLVVLFLKNNHKTLTALRLHSLYWVIFLSVITVASYIYDHTSLVTLVGAMVIHYGFDIVDDFLFLGRLNPNWKKNIFRSS